MSWVQSSDTSKKETAKKPVLGKFGNLFSSSKRRSSKNAPTSPSGLNDEKPVSSSKDIAPLKTSEKESLKDKTKSQDSVITDSKGQVQTIVRSNLEEAPPGSPRKKVTSNPLSKDDPAGKGNLKVDIFNKGGETTGLLLNCHSDGAASSLAPGIEKETKSSNAESCSHTTSVGNTSTPPQEGRVKNCLNGAVGSEFTETKKSGNTLHLSVKAIHVAKELNKNSSRASPIRKKTGSFGANITEVQSGHSEIRKGKPVFRLSKGLEQEKSSQTNSEELGQNPKGSSCSENTPNPCIELNQALLEKVSGAKEPKELADNPDEGTNPKVLTVDIYLTKTVEESGVPSPSSPKESSGDIESTMERRSSGNRKSGKKRRSFRFNANQNDDQPVWESADVEEALAENTPPCEGQTEASAPEGAAASPEQQQLPEPRAGANLKQSPGGDSDKSKQQLPPPASPTKRKAAREGQPSSPVAASPTHRKSQSRDPVQRSQPTPAAAEGCPPAGSVSTTKSGSAGERATPPGSSRGESPTTTPAEVTNGGRKDNLSDPRKLQRENSSGAAKRAPLLHTEVRAAAKRELDKSTEKLAAPSSDAAKHKSSSVIAPSPKSTVTSKLHIPAKSKNVDLNLKTKPAESLESIEEIAAEPQINRGNTANKISLFENKTSNQSHRQIEFYATKSIPLTKKFVGRAKLKFGKQPKEAEPLEISTNKPNSPQKSPENDRPVRKKLDEIKVKFEGGMEGDTMDKAEAGKGPATKKKGKSGSPKPAQLQKPHFQVSTDLPDYETKSADKDTSVPNAMTLQHLQGNELQQLNFQKDNEKPFQPARSTIPQIESDTEQHNLTTLAALDIGSTAVIALTKDGDHSAITVADKNSEGGTIEPVKTCIETTENKAKHQDSKSSLKSPSRKGDRPIGKKNDRQKKKQPFGTEPTPSPEHLNAPLLVESAKNSKKGLDIVDTHIRDKINMSETATSPSNAEPPQLKTVLDVSHGEKITKLETHSGSLIQIIDEGKTRNSQNVPSDLEGNLTEDKDTLDAPHKMGVNTFMEITDITKQVECGSYVHLSTSSSENVKQIVAPLAAIPVPELSRAGTEASMDSEQLAHATLASEIQELASDSKEAMINPVQLIEIDDRSSEFKENEGNATFETNQSVSVDSNESSKGELFANEDDSIVDLYESVFSTTSESTTIDITQDGSNVSTDLNQSVLHRTSDRKRAMRCENVGNTITHLNESTTVNSVDCIPRDSSKSTKSLCISEPQQNCKSQESGSAQRSTLGFEKTEEKMPTSHLESLDGCILHAQEPSVVTCTGNASESINEKSKNTATNTEKPSMCELKDVSDVRNEEKMIALKNELKGISEEVGNIAKDETEHSDPLLVGTASHLNKISDVQQHESRVVNLKNEKNKSISSYQIGTGKDCTDDLENNLSPKPHTADIMVAEETALLVDSHYNNSDNHDQAETHLINLQKDAKDVVDLQTQKDFMKAGVANDDKKRTIYQVAECQPTKTQTLPDRENTLIVQSCIEGEQKVHDQLSFVTDVAKNTKLPDAEISVSGYQKSACNNEDISHNGTPYVPSIAPDIHQNMFSQKQNMSPTISELFTTYSQYSNGSIENGLAFDRNGMFTSRSPSRVFNVSAVGDDGTLDSSSEMEKFTEIIRQLDSPIVVHQKRKKQRVPRSPQPSFGLAPIHEDFLEKIFDSDTFTFGLGKKERAADLAPALMLKMQNTDAATRVRPKRASTEQSFLVKSLRASNKDVPLPNDGADGKENSNNVSDVQVKRSRLEKSTIFSSLKSPLTVSSKENVFSPTVTSINTITTSFGMSQSDSTFASPKSMHTAVSSITSQMSEVTQNGIAEQGTSKEAPSDHQSNIETTFTNLSHLPLKVPSYMEKYLKTDDEKHAQHLLHVVPVPENGGISLPKTGIEFTSTFGDQKHIYGPVESAQKAHLPTFPSTDEEFSRRLKPPLSETNPFMPALDVETCLRNGQEGINPRPGKVVIFGEPNFCGNIIEIFADVPDCSSWELSPVISIKIVRGCWLLYEKPNFEGLSIPLEEGEMELTNLWGEEVTEEKGPPPTVIGSLRQVVKDYRICQIDLFTEADGMGLVTSYFDDTEEVQVFDRLQKTCSIKVHWGVWLIYEDSGFQGVPFILEPGEYPNLSFWDTFEAYIGSMRPLKMGGRKVEIPNEPKLFVYEKPFFEGKELELEDEMFRIPEDQINSGDEQSGQGKLPPFSTVTSMRVLGGVWVGYENPGFEGRQYLLEEGDYPHWSDWGGYNNQLQSVRPILADFSTAHMIMYSDKDFGEKGSNINVLGIISNMEDTGYGLKTQSIHVLSGVWVAYENADFTGEQYVLEKGKYSSYEDWGAKSFKISSVQPIILDAIGTPMGKFKVQLFSEPEFQGIVQIFEDNTNQIEDSFVARSCRVLSGSWVAFDGQDFAGRQYILEEGIYPDLCSMGCERNTSFRSLHIIDYEFSEPTIVLYSKQHYKGKQIEFTAETVNLQCLGYSTRVSSVRVVGGQWVIYEHSNYRGRQILLSPDKIPDWHTISGWHTIGSLRPLIQKRVYFKIRNKSTGQFISTNGNLDDLKLLRLQVTEDTGAEDQIWAYHEGFLKCRIAEDCCVAVAGSLVTAGSKLSLSLEEDKNDTHSWSISPEGQIHIRMKPNLVLDIKGGTQYDQHHVILNTVCAEKESQCWELLVL
ncbi:beta/gamma crystallin domain-containing protein 1 isoform X2 [Ambystoma mexicanum]|uniref:beta/gamma crystallin domain-containing protein 1 isoform X2 n=1 Tax=Ambystoma mexicanum TaxID=8296 RepID=UPI0037E9B904